MDSPSEVEESSSNKALYCALSALLKKDTSCSFLEWYRFLYLWHAQNGFRELCNVFVCKVGSSGLTATYLGRWPMAGQEQHSLFYTCSVETSVSNFHRWPTLFRNLQGTTQDLLWFFTWKVLECSQWNFFVDSSVISGMENLVSWRYFTQECQDTVTLLGWKCIQISLGLMYKPQKFPFDVRQCLHTG